MIGTDISETALDQAEKSCRDLPPDVRVEFLFDDIITTKLEPDQFDVIIDRGCYHSICVFATKQYIENMMKLLKDTGKIVLKTMSSKETRFLTHDNIGGKTIPMPYPFTPEKLREAFADHFNIEKIEDTVFFSSSTDEPGRAYLTILSKKTNGQFTGNKPDVGFHSRNTGKG